jgi:putative protease
VQGLKIEGRYKNAAYVLSAVDALRHHRDACLRSSPLTQAEARQLERDLVRTQLTFSRGASAGFLAGDNHQALVVGKSPKHRGIRLGEVSAVSRRSVQLDMPDDVRELLRPGMGVMFEVGDPERDDAPGGPIFSVDVTPRSKLPLPAADRGALLSQVELGFGKPGPDLRRVVVGTSVWLTGDPQIARETERRASHAAPQGRVGLRLEARGALGEPLRVRAQARFAGRLIEVDVASELPLTAARSGGLDSALLHDKLAALGGTAFCLETLRVELASGMHLPVSELKRLRRDLVGALTAQLVRAPWQLTAAEPALPRLRAALQAKLSAADDAPARIVPLCRTAEQLQAVIDSGVSPGDEAELDFMELVGLGAAVRSAREAGLAVTLATVRVQKPGEESYDRRIAALAPDAVLVRHWGALMHFAERAGAASETAAPQLHGDFSLNVTNAITARHVLSLGLCTVTASHDLDRAQLLALLAACPRGRVAVTLHHHIPTFHNSHCVYAHLLSEGKDYRSCGRPCESHQIALRDFAGHDHPVVVDVGCRNTVFNARAQSAAPLLPELLARGVRRFRVEFVWEKAEQVSRALAAYRALLRGELSSQAALRQVGVHEQYGVTLLRGSSQR